MKITVNNEEVVCSNELTITEEMLTTSSTILNNCYPKSWEQDHDYISRFYYPKDYSKCKISDPKFIPGVIGTTTEGTDITINYDEDKNWQLKQLKGNTYQQTYSGKNLFVNSDTFKGVDLGNLGGAEIDTTTKLGNSYSIKTNFAWRGPYCDMTKVIQKHPLSVGDKVTYSIYFKTNFVPTSQFRMKFYRCTSNAANHVINFSASDIQPNTWYRVSYTFNLNEYSLSNTKMRAEVEYYDNNDRYYFGNNRQNFVWFARPQLELGDLTDYQEYKGSYPSPNPDYPQAIQSVTGRQVVDINGKNLFDGTYINYAIGGNSGVRFFSNASSRTAIIKCQPNTIYTISKAKTTNRFTICDFPTYPVNNDELNNKQTIDTSSKIGTYTTSSNANYLCVFVSNANVEPQMQIEKGSTATSYEPYQGQQFEINLGKNLLQNTTTTQTINGITFTVNDDKSVKVSGTASATAYLAYNTFLLKAGTYTLSAGVFINSLTRIQLVEDITGRPLVASTQSFSSQTFTINENKNVFLQFRINNGEVIDKTFYPQLEKGTQSTTYSPYFTPIELCKIGDNQDYIDGDVDNWYINKYTNSVIFNGSESTWGNWSSGTIHRYYIRLSDNNIVGDKGICNYFTLGNHADRSAVGNNLKFFVGIDNNLGVFNFRYDSITTLANFKTWLSTHNTKVYYVLAEPTRTKITNTELVGQLNALAQANLLNGYNNIVVNSVNLPASLKIYYNFVDERYEENLMFCGVVKNTGNMSLNPRDPHYASLQVLDFKTMLSEGDTLGFVINNKTVPQAIQMVVDAISTYGVVVGNIDILNPDEVIGAYSTVDKTAYDVLQYLAEISQSRWTTRLIDENTIAIDFYDPTLMPQADDIEYTKEYFENNGIIDIQYNYGTYDYRNKQIMTSDQVYGSIDYVETILADGYNRTFNTTTNIGYIKSIFVNGVSKTFATKDEKEIGIESDFYYTPGQMQIESNENEPIISSNTPIVITYTPLVKGRQIIYNNDEVERVSAQTNRNGIISRYENRNDTLSIDELNQIGQTYIKYKGSAEINLIVNTFNYDLFNVGQLVYFNAPLNELKKQYMVKQKEITMYTAKSQQNIFVKYTLTSSFNSEREVNYFDNQRNKAKGNISAGEYITRNVDIENTANIIFNNLTIEEVEEGNVLNSILNSPLNN